MVIKERLDFFVSRVTTALGVNSLQEQTPYNNETLAKTQDVDNKIKALC